MPTTIKATKETERVKLMPTLNRFPRTWAVNGPGGREVVELTPNKTTVVSRRMADAMYQKAELYKKVLYVPDGADLEGRMASGQEASRTKEEHFDKNPIVFLDRD